MAIKKRRSTLEVGALRALADPLRVAGRQLRAARRRRRWTQAELGRRSELSQQTISQLERGDGATLSLAAWKRVAVAMALPLEIRIGRDPRAETRDAGHLAMQELLLRLGRQLGRTRTFELQATGARAGVMSGWWIAWPAR